MSESKAEHPAVVAPLARVQAGSNLPSMEAYQTMYDASVADPGTFWSEQARKELHWDKDFESATSGTFGEGDISWFTNGRLNVSTNCIDRHIAAGKGDQVALIHEGDEPGQVRTYTYSELLRETCRVANVFKQAGIKKGDAVTIYLPMIPEIAFTMLACCRIGETEREGGGRVRISYI